jgi:hypothetical protein
MAKQKSNTATELPDNQEGTVAGTGSAGIEQETEINQETGDKQDKELTPKEPVPVQKELSSFTEGILKMYPTYEFLYIDSQGGCYTQGTAERIRGGAILYKNPFYK